MFEMVIEPVFGVVDGVNRDFQTAREYVPGTLRVFLNGILKRGDLDDGWLELGGTLFRMKVAPRIADQIGASYLVQ